MLRDFLYKKKDQANGTDEIKKIKSVVEDDGLYKWEQLKSYITSNLCGFTIKKADCIFVRLSVKLAQDPDETFLEFLKFCKGKPLACFYELPESAEKLAHRAGESLTMQEISLHKNLQKKAIETLNQLISDLDNHIKSKSNENKKEASATQVASPRQSDRLLRLITKDKIWHEDHESLSLSPYNHHGKLHGRDNEIGALNAFLGDPSPFEFLFIIGPSGAGKTRLVTEWFRKHAAIDHWQAGFVEDDSLSESWRAWNAEPVQVDTLIIVDYIYRFRDVIKHIVNKGNHHAQAHATTDRPLSEPSPSADAPIVPKLRLIVLDHVFPDKATFDDLDAHKIEAMGETQANVVNNLSAMQKKYPPMVLQQSKKMLKAIIAESYGNLDDEDSVEWAYQTLQRIDGEVEASVDTDHADAPAKDSPEATIRYASQPLFAKLIGEALKKHPLGESIKDEELASWSRRDLVARYFFNNRNRLPWYFDDKYGQWIGAAIAAATVIQGLRFDDLFQCLNDIGVKLERKDRDHLKSTCNNIVSSRDSEELKRYEPDILGENFVFTFLDNFRYFAPCENSEPKNDVRKFFFRLLLFTDTGHKPFPTPNERFIEFIKRAVRNLLLDDQSVLSVVDGWKALAGLLQPGQYKSGNMYFSSILASVNTISDIGNSNAHGSRALQALFGENLRTEQVSYLANTFNKSSRDKNRERKVGSVWDLCLSALTRYVDWLLENGNLSKEIEEIFENSAEVYEQTAKHGQKRIFIPCLYDARNVLKWLIENYREIDINYQSDKKGSPLHYACFFGSTKVGEFLLSQPEINVNLKDTYLLTPLMRACHSGAEELALQLIAKGANLEAQTKDKWTVLMIACLYSMEKVALRLIAKNVNLGVQTKDKWTALMFACANGMENVALRLVAKDANLEAQIKDKSTALMFACRYGMENVALRLVAKDANLEAQDKYKMTALMIACENGLEKVALGLVAKDANLGAQDKDKATALMYACENGLEKVALGLVAKDANLGAQDKGKATALMFACAKGLEEVALGLVAKDANLGAQDKGKATALMVACAKGLEEVALWLVAKDANLEAQEKDKWTALMVACVNGLEKVALRLVAKDANLEAQNKDKWTALMLACLYSSEKVALELVAKDANLEAVGPEGMTALMWAANCCSSRVVGALLDKQVNTDGVFQNDKFRVTALGLARGRGDKEIIRLLEQKGALEILSHTPPA